MVDRRAEILSVLQEFVVADATEVLSELQRRGSSTSRPTVFRHLDKMVQEGQLGLIQMGRTRFFTIKAKVGVFRIDEGRPFAIDPSPDLLAALEKAAGRGNAFLFLDG